MRCFFFFSSRRRHTRCSRDWSSDVCSSDLGCVDVETRIPLLFSEGVVKRRLPITRLVQVASTNPARIFGLYPRKGVIAAGSDADIVLIDPTARLRVSPQTLHMKVQYSPYEGWDVVGMPVTTISRGKVIVNKG